MYSKLYNSSNYRSIRPFKLTADKSAALVHRSGPFRPRATRDPQPARKFWPTLPQALSTLGRIAPTWTNIAEEKV